MSVGDENLIGTNISGSEITGPLLLNPLIKDASMVGGICTSGTYSVYAVIIPTQSNWDTNHFKLYLITYDNFTTNGPGVTPNYQLPQPYVASQGGFCLNYYSFGGANIQINIPSSGQYFNINFFVSGAPNHRSAFFLYGF
jgi:hypothetical protein